MIFLYLLYKISAVIIIAKTWISDGASPCKRIYYMNYAYNVAYNNNENNNHNRWVQARIKIVGRNINNLRYTVDMVLMAESGDRTIMAESEEELKILLVKVKEKSEKAGLKLNIQKT